MMEFLHFTFQSFWHFVGVLILLSIVVQGAAVFLAALIKTLKP